MDRWRAAITSSLVISKPYVPFRALRLPKSARQDAEMFEIGRRGQRSINITYSLSPSFALSLSLASSDLLTLASQDMPTINSQHATGPGIVGAR
ncbi:hypothetical protein E2C01_092972 [Portunus trituberculatus]|uniref:Uncharacterized protein n=1 Tax=Portunus trituberculatus TaxID=210409 RepID=A0A5B7JXE4_PORTR|nr:hypothetical protein [Portunus trituberculatus]